MIKKIFLGPYLVEGFDEEIDKGVVRILKKHTNFEQLSGVKLTPNPQVLGSGTKGDVVTTADPKVVLKITEDRKEALSASKITRRWPGLYLPFGSYSLRYKWPYYFDTELWFIPQERLRNHSLSKNLGYAFSQGKGWFCSLVEEHLNVPYAGRTLTWTDKILERVLVDPKINSTIAEKLGNANKEYLFEICRGMNSLCNLKIQFEDVHPGNIMWRIDIDKPVILDIGFSDSQGGKINKIKLI